MEILTIFNKNGIVLIMYMPLSKNNQTFYDGVTASIEKGRTTDIIYLDFSMAFDTVSKSFSSNWKDTERYARYGWTIQWMKH